MVDVKRGKKLNHGKTLDRLNARITNSNDHRFRKEVLIRENQGGNRLNGTPTPSYKPVGSSSAHAAERF